MTACISIVSYEWQPYYFVPKTWLGISWNTI
jgi:hypothetical protein